MNHKEIPDDVFFSALNEYGAKQFFEKQFFRLAGANPSRIEFLFEETLSTSKRYERFEKKMFKKLLEYVLDFIPHEYEEFELAVADYITNTITLKADTVAFAFNHAMYESKESRNYLASLLPNSIGVSNDENLDTMDEIKYSAFVAHITNEARKYIRNCLIAKALYDINICESNYTLVTEFTNADLYAITSNTIQSAIDYIIFCNENDVSPNCLDYQGMQSQKNAMIAEAMNEINCLQKENESLKKRLIKKKQEPKKIKTKIVKTDNPELIKENKLLQEEIQRLKTAVEDLEAVIELKECANEKEDVLRDVRGDKILFVGGHDNELKKLAYIFANSENLVRASTDIQANYLSRFDYIVFLTHYMSHSLYHKIKGQADLLNVPYIHCEYNNPKLIAEYIAKHLPGERKVAIV